MNDTSASHASCEWLGCFEGISRHAVPTAATYPEMGLTGVAMLLEPGTALLGTMPMSTDSTSKGIGGLPLSFTRFACNAVTYLHALITLLGQTALACEQAVHMFLCTAEST